MNKQLLKNMFTLAKQSKDMDTLLKNLKIYKVIMDSWQFHKLCPFNRYTINILKTNVYSMTSKTILARMFTKKVSTMMFL